MLDQLNQDNGSQKAVEFYTYLDSMEAQSMVFVYKNVKKGLVSVNHELSGSQGNWIKFGVVKIVRTKFQA